MNKSTHHDTARTVIGFFTVCLMAGIFFVFYNNQDTLIESNQLLIFVTLAIVGAGFLVSLLYLASKPVKSHKAAVHKAVSRKVHKKKKSSTR